jgi:catechol 2,3-dioxygenase-like lactoylglutathione lyase family enzyme
MSFAHFTMPTRDVEGTAAFLEETLGYRRDPVPANTPVETAWLNLGRGQQIHIFYVDGFTVSPFEQEFGRHVAVFYPVPFDGLKEKLTARGAAIFDPIRPSTFERFFFREPVNGYVFEVIDAARAG